MLANFLKEIKNIPPMVIDTSGEMFFISSEEAKKVKNISNIDNFLYYILDTTSTSEPGIYTVIGPYKYAEIMAKKKLEERGDITPEETFIIYQKKKEDKTKTTVIYNLIPTNVYDRIREQYNSFSHGMVVFDSMGIACAYLERIAKNDPIGIVCESASSTVMVVGKKGEFLLSRRYEKEGLLNFGEEDTSALIEQDLIRFEKDKGIKVGKIIWCPIFIRGKSPTAPEFTSCETSLLPFIQKEVEGEIIFTSLPYIIEKIPFNYALFGKEERWIRPLEKAEVYLWGTMLFVSCVLIGIFFLFSNTQKRLEAKSKELSQVIKAYERSLDYFSPKIKGKERGKGYNQILSFSQKLIRSQKAPSYGFFWKIMDEIRPKGVYLTEMDVYYGKKSAKVSLTGEIPDTMLQAQQSFSSFLTRLTRAGFKIKEQHINLGLDTSSFLVNLVYSYNTAYDGN